MANIEKKYMTVTAAMGELGLSRARALALVHAGTVESLRIGWHILIDRKSLATYKAAQERENAGAI